MGPICYPSIVLIGTPESLIGTPIPVMMNYSNLQGGSVSTSMLQNNDSMISINEGGLMHGLGLNTTDIQESSTFSMNRDPITTSSTKSVDFTSKSQSNFHLPVNTASKAVSTTISNSNNISRNNTGTYNAFESNQSANSIADELLGGLYENDSTGFQEGLWKAKYSNRANNNVDVKLLDMR